MTNRVFAFSGWGATAEAVRPLGVLLGGEVSCFSLVDLWRRSGRTLEGGVERLRAGMDEVISTFVAGDVCIGWSTGGMLLIERLFIKGAFAGKPQAVLLVGVTDQFLAPGDATHRQALRALRRRYATQPREAVRGFGSWAGIPEDYQVSFSADEEGEAMAAGLDFLEGYQLPECGSGSGSASGKAPWAVPPLVVHGQEDHVVVPEGGRMLAQKIPGGCFQEIKGAGHNVVFTQPVAIAQAWKHHLAASQ